MFSGFLLKGVLTEPLNTWQQTLGALPVPTRLGSSTDFVQESDAQEVAHLASGGFLPPL